MLNHYFGLFSCIEYVNFEYKQYEQFIFDSFFEKILGKPVSYTHLTLPTKLEV